MRSFTTLLRCFIASTILIFLTRTGASYTFLIIFVGLLTFLVVKVYKQPLELNKNKSYCYRGFITGGNLILSLEGEDDPNIYKNPGFDLNELSLLSVYNYYSNKEGEIFFEEDMIKSIRAKINYASNNAIDPGREAINENGLLKKEHRHVLNHASAYFNNFVELGMALKIWGLKDDEIDNIVEHENAHMNMAEYLKVETNGYLVSFIKQDRKVRLYAAAIQLNTTLEDPKIHEAIIRAPLDYGNKLSIGDIEMLNELKLN